MTRNTLYDAAELYDLIGGNPAANELDFYQRLIASYGSHVLELACGTGRLTMPLYGYTSQVVTGLDNSQAMLARGRAKADAAGARVRWLEADMRSFDAGDQFNLVILPFNSISHLLTRVDIEQTLRCVRAHLAPGGRFLVAMFNPSLTILGRDPDTWHPVKEFVDAAGRGWKLIERNTYDAAAQVNTIAWRCLREDGERVDLQFVMRQFFPQELDEVLHYNGFAIDAKYGDYDEAPFTGASMHQLVVAQAA